MKSRYILPALAAVIAGGGAFFTLQAQDPPAPRSERNFEFKFNGDPRHAGPMKEQLRRMMEQMDPGGEGQKKLDEALKNWEANADEAPGQPKQFRFEFRNDGSGPRLFRDGKEVKPGEGGDGSGNPLEEMQKQMQKEMEELFRRHMGGGSGDGGNPLDELFKQMREREGQPGHEGLQDLFRQFQQRPGGRQPADSASRYSKLHRSALAEWRPLVKVARESTVRIMKDDQQVAFGTIVSADGYALTKASEVNKDGLECEFHDGRIVSAKVIDKLDAYDLALIKLDATGLTPANFAGHDATVGTLVAAVGVDEDPLAVGIISVPARSLSEKGKGALGIQFDQTQDESAKGVLIGEVLEKCAADEAGLKKGDIILSVNGTEVDFPFQLQKMVAAMKPGDSVKVRYSRDGKESEIEFPLSSREELVKVQEEKNKASGLGQVDRRSLDPTAQMGSSLSGNYKDYPNAVQSDVTIDASDCGSPVVDVEGHVVAINIARAERVSTYMIPGKVVKALLSNLESGKFTLAKDADTLQGELREYETAIRKAQDAMKAAEARRAEAEAALRKLGK